MENIMESHDGMYIEWMEDTNLFKNSFRDLNTFFFYFYLNQTFHKGFYFGCFVASFFKLKAKIL